MRSVRLARQAIAKERREGDGRRRLLDRRRHRPRRTGRRRSGCCSARSPASRPTWCVVEGLLRGAPDAVCDVEALLAIGLPVWLSFRRCRHGLCGVYGQHWGGPEGDAFGRAARRFEELGVGALLLGCIPPDHVAGMLSYLRDFTDLPLGVHPNLGYLTSNGWQRRRRRRSRRVRAHGAALARGGRAAHRRLLRRRVRTDRRCARGAGRDAAGGAASQRRGVPRARRRPRGAARAVGRCGRALAVPARLPGPRRAARRVRPVAGLVHGLAPPVRRADRTRPALPGRRLRQRPAGDPARAQRRRARGRHRRRPPRPPMRRSSTRFATAWSTA